MGGKHKQAQRTKNNARPSSSGRSAELLGNSTPTFVGFTAVKDGSVIPVLPGLPEFDPNLNSHFLLVLKKMGKKDSTTKLKALQEFSELITNSELEAVKTVLPLWPRLYCQLAVDVEHRVREAVQQAQRAVVLRVKRNLAPYLRQLAGPWFTSQYDTYPPAASAAALAFEDAFPPKKVIEAIIFCQEEILNYICDNLLVQTAHTLSNPKAVTPEDMEAKHQRVVVSSLQGYALYLHKLPAEQLRAAYEANKKLIASKKFWNLSKHSSALVRNAWFTVLIAVCQKAPDLLAEEGARTSLAVFGNLDETDPIVLPTVWEASLHILTRIKDCWQHVNAEKVVLRKLWRILREGGQGNAATIFPNILPFLSKIPSSVCSNKQLFYDNFFNNILHGLNQKLVLQSASECSAIARCYIECLKYTVMLHISDLDFCQALIQNHLIAAVVLMLKDQKFKLVSASLFPELSVLIYQWSNMEGYLVLVQHFWNCLTSVVLESLSPVGESFQSSPICAEWLLNTHTELCLCLKNPKHKRSRQGLRVKFLSPENNSDDESPETENCADPDLSATDDVHVDKYLQSFVEVLCVSYGTKADQYSDPIFFVYLEKLTRAFESRELFFSLLKVTVAEDIQTESNESLVQLYDTRLQKWLQDEKVCSESVIRITFAFLKFLTADGKNHVLDALCKMSNTSMLVWCMSCALEYRSESSVQEWLHSAQLSEILLSLTHDICSNKTDVDAGHILETCFDKIKDGDLVISPAVVSNILSEFSLLISTSHDDPICLDFVLELVTSLYSGDLNLCPFLHSNLAAEDLLLSLFRLSCQNNTSRKGKVDGAWCAGVSSLARLHGNCSETFLKFTLKFAEVVKEELLTREDVLIIPIDHIVATVVAFLCTAARCFPTDSGDQVSCLSTLFKLSLIFLDCVCSEVAAIEQKLAVICLYAENLKGLLNHTVKHSHAEYLFDTNHHNIGKSGTENSDTVGSGNEMVHYVTLLLFSVTLISKLPESLNIVDSVQIKNDLKEEDMKQEMSHCDVCVLEEHISTVTYSVALCKTFIRHFKSSVYYYRVFLKNDVLDERFKLLMNTFDAKETDSITRIIARRALQCGNLWVKALHLLQAQVLTQSNIHELMLDVASDAVTGSSQTIQISEIFPSCLKVEDLRPDEATLNEDKLLMLTSWMNELDGPISETSGIHILSFLYSVFDWYQQDDKAELLFDCEVKWPQANRVIATARFLAALIEKCPHLLTSRLWDAVIISLASWMMTVKNSRNLLLLPSESGILPLLPETLPSEAKENIDVHPGSRENLLAVTAYSNLAKSFCLDSNNEAKFAMAVFQLYKALSDLLTRCYNDLDGDVQILLENMKMEWTDVFADAVHEAVVSVFHTVIDFVRINSVSVLDLPLLESLGDAVLQIDAKFFSSGSTDDNRMIKCCCELLCSPVIPLQLTAYRMLTRLVHGLIDLDTRVGAEHEKFGLSVLQDYLQETQAVVQDLLLDICVGNSCTVRPFTDAYTYTMAYLMLWDVVFQVCGLANSELRSQYASLIRELGSLNSLLQNVFRLMPEEVLQTKDPKFKLQKTSEMFCSAPSLAFSQPCNSETLEHMSCWVYCNALRRLPALVRQWWGDLEPKVATLVEQVTSVYCAPVLCAEEMKVIQAKDMHHGNMLMKVYPSVREVVAVYKLDEAEMELSIQLPTNYPLGTVHIEGRKLPDPGQWRKQMKELIILLTHQNGSIQDGLEHWKSNLDKRFEGVEECHICFSVIHSSNLQVPRKKCSKCKKKFHSSCLVRWINTSNKATCPICRNMF